MLFVGAAAVGLFVSPGLGRVVAVATDRRPDPRLVAAVAVAVALLIAWRAEGVPHAAALSAVAAGGIAAGWVDAYERRLPDALVLPLYPVVEAILVASGDADRLLRTVLVAATVMGLFAVGSAVGHLGFGDVKLAGLLALVLAWSDSMTAVVALMATILIGGAQAAVVIALGRRDFPYGPAMLAGAAAALAVAPLLHATVVA